MMTTDDSRLARDLAAAAGQRLLGLRAAGGDPAELRSAGDRGSHEFLAARLAELRPEDAVLSEEGRDDLGRLSAGRHQGVRRARPQRLGGARGAVGTR
jgi:3'(2'), 5'-bisphosphate nucleotidase